MKRIDPVLVWLGLIALVFADLLFLPVTIFGRDVNSYFLPLERAIHAAWASGHLPLWFSEVSGGKPLLPNPNAGAFYPPRVITAALPFAYGFKLYLVFHVFLAGWGVLRLAGAFGSGRGGSLVAAVVYALSGPMLSAVLFSNMLPGLALLPWIVTAGFRLAAAPSFRRAALVAALLTLDVLGGEPFTVALALLALAAFSASAPRENRMRAFGFSALALAAALLAAGVQLLPMTLYLPETFRAQVRFRLLATLQWSLSPARLIEWIVPYPFGDPTEFVSWKTWGGRFFDGRPSGYFATIFAGSFATAALLLPRVRFPNASVARALRLLFASSLLLSCAAIFVPRPWLSAPTRVALRYPEKFIVGATLVIALFAARAWEEASRSRRFAIPLWLAAGGLALAGFGVSIRAPAVARWVLSWTRDGRASIATVGRALPHALLESSFHWAMAAAAATLLGFSAGRRLAAGAACLLVAADVTLATRRIIRATPESDVFDPPPAIAALRRLDPGGRFSFVPQANYFPIPAPLDTARAQRADRPPEITLRAFAGSLWGRPSVLNSDPDASDLARHAFARRDFFQVLLETPASAANFLAGYSIAYLVRYPDAAPLPGALLAARAGDVDIDRLPGAVPRFSIASHAEEFPSAAQVESALRGGTFPPDVAMIETGRRASGAAAAGSLESIAEDESGFDAAVSCADGCWLRATRGYWKFRDVRIDGARAEVVPERVALSAVRVPPGRHRITWRERLPGGIWGGAMSALGIAMIGAAARRG